MSDPFETLEGTQQWVREHLHFINVDLLTATPDLDTLHNLAVKLALFMQDERSSLPGQVWILADDTPHAPLLMHTHWENPQENPRDRRMVLESVRRLVTVLRCTRYAVMTEGYAVSRNVPPDQPVDPHKLRGEFPKDLRDAPEHYEILFIASIEKTGEHRVTSYRVTRDPEKGDSAPPLSRVIEGGDGQKHGFDGDLFAMFR